MSTGSDSIFSLHPVMSGHYFVCTAVKEPQGTDLYQARENGKEAHVVPTMLELWVGIWLGILILLLP